MSETNAPEVPAAETADEREKRWFREVYQGDSARQLTLRAAVLGMFLGGLMSFSNLVIALKTGWSFGVTITAGILAFVIAKGLHAIGLFKTRFGMLENNAMQSVASAAGYMTGGGTAAAIPALMMVNHASIPGHVMFFWITVIAMLGVFMAIPMKRQMINQEGLRFPSGIAAAETLRGLYPEEAAALDARKGAAGAVTPGDAGYRDVKISTSATEDAAAAGRWLINAMGVGALWAWLRGARAWWQFWPNIPDALEFTELKIHGIAAKKWSISFDTSLLLMAGGAIMGWRSAWSMMLGAMINYTFLAPYGHTIGAIGDVKYKNIVGWTVWLGSPMLLTAGLVSFAFSWRQIARAFGDLGKLFGTKSAGGDDAMANVEVPMLWFVGGVVALTPVIAVLAWIFFGIAWWMSLLCVALSFFIAIVASRATGETDVTPTGALAKITQIVFGGVAPGSVTTNLMTASMGSGVAIHAADLLTDLKSGYLLGARPRQQFLAQFFGVMAGSVCVVWAFQLLVPNYTVLGDTIPAPAAIAWKSVAEVLSQGLHRLPKSAQVLVAVGASLGVILVLVERALPASAKKYMPTATGLGLAFTLPFSNAQSMFLGAVIALAMEQKYTAAKSEKWIIPVSSGIIAGESLTEIAVKMLENFHLLAH
jgi:uncharacterized oligopeptide transporter (OPT) family protein